LTVVKQLY